MVMWVLLAAWLVGTADAYEVDAWSARSRVLTPADESADAAMDAMLDAAADRVRRRCPADLERLHGALARAIARETGRRTVLHDRPWPRSLGHGAYSGWLESGPVDRVDGAARDGVFRGIGVGRSPILATAGTASSVSLGGHVVGTDKVDHFLATGYRYWRWSDRGRVPERALRRGTATERWFLGRVTSNAFSYADLAANTDGLAWYSGLFEAGLFRPDPEACVVRAQAFSWSVHVDARWDEFANPSRYGRRVAEVVATNLAPDREAVCEAWSAVPPVDRTGTHVGRAPPARGPFGLADFCEVRDGTGGGTAHPDGRRRRRSDGPDRGQRG